MNQKRNNSYAYSFLVALCIGVFTPTHAMASAIFQITASGADQANPNFSLTFEDLDGDTLLSLDEILTFSGFSLPSFPNEFDTILQVPIITNIADGSGLSWEFVNGASVAAGGGAGISRDSGLYDYSIGPSPKAVPAPGTLALLGLGLAGLGWLRRNKAE
tara:strand:- start:1023 stop:1502 length:480 start_codon:yes stop_codon:yes gene_type:complete